jgi:endonuclease/exonuclease/phosphatase (EEP) superfamily protein YafD
LRIDRCLLRGVACLGARALLREASDHRPIVVTLAAASLAETDAAMKLGVVA